MNRALREMQLKVLKSFKKHHGKFALAGGTALELFYLNHRFSKDLDFFSPEYSKKEAQGIVSAFTHDLKVDIRLTDEFNAGNRAHVLFYQVPVKGFDVPLKIDFVEDVLFAKPRTRKFREVTVYSAENIYHQKICAIAGGRNEVRDVIDLYYLSLKIRPLSEFLKNMPPAQQRGIINWYRSFSRQDFKLEFLEFELYDKKLDAVSVIRHLEKEIDVFMEEVVS